MPDRSVGQQTMPLIITNEETKEIFVDQCIKELVNNRLKENYVEYRYIS